MIAQTVLHILDLFAAAGVQVWLDGGWGVDALLGRTTRSHNDLDLILDLDDLPHAMKVLIGDGFGVEEEELGRAVLRNAARGRVDLHPVTFDPHGNGVQVQPAVSPVVYRSEGFVSGRIEGRSVPCIAADVQVFARLGHDRSAKHRHDLAALCSAFGLPAPKEWDAVPPSSPSEAP